MYGSVRSVCGNVRRMYGYVRPETRCGCKTQQVAVPVIAIRPRRLGNPAKTHGKAVASYKLLSGKTPARRLSLSITAYMKNLMPDVAIARRKAPLITPTDLSSQATKDISGAMNAILADVFALYLKYKNFHWHVSGPHFRDFHLMLDEQSEQLLATTDPIAERIRKIGGTTIRSIGQVHHMQRVLDNDAVFVTPMDMMAELREDNAMLAARLREVHGLCNEYDDIATASLIETWVDEAERRAWFLFETSRIDTPEH